MADAVADFAALAATAPIIAEEVAELDVVPSSVPVVSVVPPAVAFTSSVAPFATSVAPDTSAAPFADTSGASSVAGFTASTLAFTSSALEASTKTSVVALSLSAGGGGGILVEAVLGDRLGGGDALGVREADSVGESALLKEEEAVTVFVGGGFVGGAFRGAGRLWLSLAYQKKKISQTRLKGQCES